MQRTSRSIGPILSLFSALLVMGASLCGCGNPQRTALTAQDIAEHGTATFEAPRETVFRACVLGLEMSGFAVDVAEPVTGIVVTLPRPTRDAEPVESGPRLFRGYVVEIASLAGGKVQVTATPTVHAGRAADRHAPRPAWNLDHERAAWKRLLGDVHALVDREQENAN